MFFSAVSIKSARMSYINVIAMFVLVKKKAISSYRLCMLIFLRLYLRVKCRYHTAMFFSAVSIRTAIFMARRFFEFMFIMVYLTVVPIWLVCSYWPVSLLLVLQFVTLLNMCRVRIWMG